MIGMGIGAGAYVLTRFAVSSAPESSKSDLTIRSFNQPGISRTNVFLPFADSGNSNAAYCSTLLGRKSPRNVP